MPISVLCFSKDRPLQLEGYLSSLLRMSGQPLPIRVLYKCAHHFNAAYGKLEQSFPEVEFVIETDFKTQVLDYVYHVNTPLFMFGCDDVVFKRAWEPGEILKTFQLLPGLLAFSLRLGREITYSGRRTMSNPRFSRTDPALVWEWRRSGLDWAYPWELDCTVYEAGFVKGMLNAIEILDWAHPNRLEGIVAYLIQPIRGLYWAASHRRACACLASRLGRGIASAHKGLNQAGFSWLGIDLVRKLAAVRSLKLMASYPSARASVITVNRVQDVALNPVYKGGLSADILLDKWNNGIVMDTERYINREYPTIHVGELYLRHR